MSTQKITKEEVSARISSALHASGKKAKDVANACGITEVTMSKYVNGVSFPKNQYLVALARELNVTVSWVLTGLEETHESEYWKKRALSAESKLKHLKRSMANWLSKM